VERCDNSVCTEGVQMERCGVSVRTEGEHLERLMILLFV
jgi:hypothetical protein